MSIPDFQTLMLPVLRLANDGKEHSLKETIDKLATQFTLKNTERNELLPSGRETVFGNRVGWARTYLKKAGLLRLTRWGFVSITPLGSDFINRNPERVNIAALMQFPGFKQFKSPAEAQVKPNSESEPEVSGTPQEQLDAAYQQVRADLANDLLQQVKAISPAMFERLVLDLLTKMGYGGSFKEARAAVGGIGDEGIDGIINEDKLGLDRIYIQAKRWQNFVVGRPEIQKFAGALQGKHARKGIFITTSDYTREAREFAAQIENPIILVDGGQIAQLMMDYGIGVNTTNTYVVQRIDSDYFAEE